MKITKAQLRQIIKEELSNLFEDEMGSLEASPLVATALKANKIPSISALLGLIPQLSDAVLEINDVTKKVGRDYDLVWAMQIVVAFEEMIKTKNPERIKKLTQRFKELVDLRSKPPKPPPGGIFGATRDLAIELTSAGFPAKYANIINPSYRDYETKTPHRVEFTGGDDTVDDPRYSGDKFDGRALYKKTSEDLNSAVDYLMGKGWQKVMAGQAKDITVLVAGPRVEKKYRNYVLHTIQIPKIRGWFTKRGAFKGKSFGVTTKRTAKKKGLI